MCDALAKSYGPRFKPNKQLREMAKAGGSYYAATKAA
jgi:3-hydroxyacyl-CoA dehydrogenase/enoyl-CoA hydratase/3-hydroxybutyryl-CoA epimerase